MEARRPVTGFEDPGYAGPVGVPVFETVLSVTDAHANGDEWLLLDAKGHRIHRFDANGELTHSFGRDGLGPGELREPAALVTHGDSIVVVERFGLLHLFDLAGEHLLDRYVDYRGCAGPGTVEVASTRAGLVFLVVCFDDRGALEARAIVETSRGDSDVIATSSPNRLGEGVLEPYFLPVLAPYGDGVLFGLAGEGCLTAVDMAGDSLGSVCHDWISRLPVPERQQEALARIRRQARSRGLDVAMPDSLPRFDRIFTVAGSRVVYRAPAMGGANLMRLISAGSQGAEAVFGTPPAEYVFFGGKTALVAWDDLTGIRIALAEAPHE